MLKQYPYGLSFKILGVLMFYIISITMMAYISHDDFRTASITLSSMPAGLKKITSSMGIRNP
jgi:hypothetical protein